MNIQVTALLFLSVAVTASAIAVRDQKYERGLQTQDDGNLNPNANFPWGGDKNSENNNEAHRISSDDIESVRRRLQALQQRNVDALQSAPKAKETICETIDECIQLVYIPRECVIRAWVCIQWRDARYECKDNRYRKVTKCRHTHKRGDMEDSPIDSPKREKSQEESTENDSEQADTVEGQQTEIAKLQAESLATFRYVYQTKVVKAEKYERPASTSREDVSSEEDYFAVVIVTLIDGRRYAIGWGRGLWDDNSSAILNADRVTGDRQLVESKDIQFSTVADYVQASDSGTSYGESAEKMMKLD